MTILLVDDDAGVREVLQFQLEEAGWSVVALGDGLAARQHLERDDDVGLVVSDVRMPRMDGVELLGWIRQHRPGVPVILVSAYGDVEKAVEAMRLGAEDYLTKPVKRAELLARVSKALDRSALRAENQALRAALHDRGPLDRIVGVSPAVTRLKEVIRRMAPSDAPVLIRGESGTGKELVARSLHELSPRAEGPFVTVNCGAIPSELLESELFGHERGAFTGATGRHIGRIERASGGTLFLDEVGELRTDHQVKLLRVLQEHELERVGGSGPVPVDVRVLAATNVDLHAAVREGRFREDLYYRLNVLPLDVPPLRARSSDVPVLARHFLSGLAAGEGVTLAPKLVEAMTRYGWPGNVRELQNVVERMTLLRTSDVLTPADFHPDAPVGPAGAPLAPGSLVLPDEGFSLPELEREIVEKALERHGGNQSATARYLGIPRHVLLYRLGKYEGE